MLVIHTFYFLLQEAVQQQCYQNSFWVITHSIVTVKWNGCRKSTKWPIVEPTLESWTWTTSNVD